MPLRWRGFSNCNVLFFRNVGKCCTRWSYMEPERTNISLRLLFSCDDIMQWFPLSLMLMDRSNIHPHITLHVFMWMCHFYKQCMMIHSHSLECASEYLEVNEWSEEFKHLNSLSHILSNHLSRGLYVCVLLHVWRLKLNWTCMHFVLP